MGRNSNLEAGIGRRRFVQGLGVTAAATTAGCFFLDGDQSTDSSGEPISGTVIDKAGDPIHGASVEFLRENGSVLESVDTDSEGVFESTHTRPLWVRASHPEFTSQIRAVGPGDQTQFRLFQDTVSLAFTGDVMFGRRFYEPNDDSSSPRIEFDEDSLTESHQSVMQPTTALLETPDITSINLETPLTTAEPAHPSKSYQFASRPEAVAALESAGVDYAALGNNHAMDALEEGFQDTTQNLETADIDYSGAGYGSDEAWEPAVVERGDLTLAFISCTTVNGQQFDVNWSADRDAGGEYEIEQDGETKTIPADLGVAEPNPDRLEAAITDANQQADVVIVQIHGGSEYNRKQTDTVESLSYHAADVGADLVVNHHPHVAGGIEYYDDTLIAWTLGNFVFDQEFWEPLRSYVLTVEVTNDAIVRGGVEPILINGFVPKGVTGSARQRLLHEITGLSSSDFVVQDDRVTDLTSGPVTEPAEGRVEIQEDGELLERTTGAISNIESQSGTVRFGHDRLITGEFSDSVVDDQRFNGPLWRYGRNGESKNQPEYGSEGGGLRLTRDPDNTERAFLTPRYRIRAYEDEYSLSLTYRGTIDENASIQVSWYDERHGNSFTSSTHSIPNTDGEWDSVMFNLSVPENGRYIDVFVFLEPPTSKETKIDIDRVRLVEWLDGDQLRKANHLDLDGSVTVDVINGDDFDWQPTSVDWL
ncbi:CapA family protein [Natrialba taiwanensis]|nr:CapA family protein [Natrialba taiwanensis]